MIDYLKRHSYILLLFIALICVLEIQCGTLANRRGMLKKRKLIIPIGHWVRINCLDTTTDDTFLATGGNELKLWHVPSKRLLGTAGGHYKAITAVAFSKDKNYLFSGDCAGNIRIFSVPGLRLIKTLSFNSSIKYIDYIGFSNSGKYALFALCHKLIIWDIEKQKIVKKLYINGSISNIYDAKEGCAIYCIIKKKIVKVNWHTGKREVLSNCLQESIITCPVTKRVFYFGRTGSSPVRKYTGYLVNGTNGELIATFMRLYNKEFLQTLAFSNDGKIILLCGTKRFILLDGATLQVKKSLNYPSKRFVDVAVFARKSQFLITAERNVIFFYSTKRNFIKKLIPPMPLYLKRLAYSPDGTKILVSGSGIAFIINTTTGKIREVCRDLAFASGVAFSADSHLLAVARKSGGKICVNVYETVGLKIKNSFAGFTFNPTTIRFSPDGNFLLTAARGIKIYGEMKLWNLLQRHSTRPVQQHKRAVYDAQFTPDGKYIIDHFIWKTAMAHVYYFAGIKTLPIKGTISAFAVGKKEKCISLYNDETKKLEVYRWPDWKLMYSLELPDDRKVSQIAILSDKKILYSDIPRYPSIAWGDLYFQDLGSSKKSKIIMQGFPGLSTSLSMVISKNKKFVFFTDRGYRIIIICLASGKRVATYYPVLLEKKIHWIIVSHDGKYDCSQGLFKHLNFRSPKGGLIPASKKDSEYVPGLLGKILN